MNLNSLPQFVAMCDHLGIQTPRPIARAREMLAVIAAHKITPYVNVLELTDDEVRAHVEDLALRQHQGPSYDTRGLHGGADALEADLAAQLRTAMIPELDQMIEDIQYAFAEAAAPIMIAAREYDITASTEAGDVIDRGALAIDAFRAARDALPKVEEFARFRKSISTMFEVEPTVSTLQRAFSLYTLEEHAVDYSVCFAEGVSWSYDGRMYLDPRNRAAIDWFALGAGGLRLNTISDVAAKIEQRSKPSAPPLTAAPWPS